MSVTDPARECWTVRTGRLSPRLRSGSGFLLPPLHCGSTTDREPFKRLAPVPAGVTRKREYRSTRRMPSRPSTVVTVRVKSPGQPG